MNETSLHIREVVDVIGGAPSMRDSLVRDSWRRCVDQHGLDPTRRQRAHVLPDSRLREHRDPLESLIRTARFGLESLYRQVAGQDYVVLLSDKRGISVDYIGDRGREGALHRAGLTLGSDWSESHAGTCAVGACIASGEPVVIHRSDHFDATHIPLTCTAAPIYDARGELAAVVDISALHSPPDKISQALALQLVRASTLRIELAHLMASFRSEWILRFSRSQEFVDVDPEAAIAIDASGRVVGTTHAGRKLMARALGLDWRSMPSLLGRSFSEAFDVELDELPRFTRALPTCDRSIRLRNGERLYAHAAEPHSSSGGQAQRSAAPAASRAIPATLQGLSGGDEQMDRMLVMAARLADQPIALLLQGETGCGKEVLARAIHDSGKHSGPFVAINCAALPETLIESELFGYVPGAFTGARARGRKGLIEEAHGGTLFLDEIGDMPLSLQARLLRVLAEREVVPLGGSRPIPVNLRIISATHRELADHVRSGAFREDLFYRLSGAVLRIPALRSRRDLGWLLDRLLQSGGRKSNGALRPVRVSRAAREALEAHHWPGNIRELVNVVELARVLCNDGVIELDDLPALRAQASESTGVDAQTQAGDGASKLAALLRECHWNISEAARRLGVDRTTLHRRMRRIGLVAPNRRPH
ncbi:MULTISPECIES: sigma-54-dependent Fis family transcriptional regulator [Hydrocarboniphaga]|jgi:transcriptional regulator of acetoin/glycerol metabolism|uniref:Acetoin catabolism regulatory protein n=3 Tax=Hydrocarboniphaga effusa TaxID=243629 RepID=I8HX93_9GAMM|nr:MULTISPECIES: sigma-54-dependent Fis family transcriptional regulator [Hydrocarboniphaga]EIT67966.1 acetoin catabolism regulatory protein [Hydrocarboniphaga effusa AP103]MDZ4076974.1 sigma-54-dependent Fis family transcriptional regulator [Hydrocarboniphaga sp.]